MHGSLIANPVNFKICQSFDQNFGENILQHDFLWLLTYFVDVFILQKYPSKNLCEQQSNGHQNKIVMHGSLKGNIVNFKKSQSEKLMGKILDSLATLVNMGPDFST